jgi:hypothetical protein
MACAERALAKWLKEHVDADARATAAQAQEPTDGE